MIGAFSIDELSDLLQEAGFGEPIVHDLTDCMGMTLLTSTRT